MSRIFSVKRFLYGFIFAIPSIWVLCLLISDDNKGIFEYSFELIFFIFVLYYVHLMTAHTAYNSEKVVALSLFWRKSIRYENIVRLEKKYKFSRAGSSCWLAFYRDDFKDCEQKTTLYLPDNPEGNGVQSLFAAIKEVNPSATLVIDED